MNTNFLDALAELSDRELLGRLDALAGKEREASAELVAHLARIDTENEYCLFASAARAGFETQAPNFRVITAPLAHRGSWTLLQLG